MTCGHEEPLFDSAESTLAKAFLDCFSILCDDATKVFIQSDLLD